MGISEFFSEKKGTKPFWFDVGWFYGGIVGFTLIKEVFDGMGSVLANKANQDLTIQNFSAEDQQKIDKQYFDANTYVNPNFPQSPLYSPVVDFTNSELFPTSVNVNNLGEFSDYVNPNFPQSPLYSPVVDFTNPELFPEDGNNSSGFSEYLGLGPVVDLNNPNFNMPTTLEVPSNAGGSMIALQNPMNSPGLNLG